MRTAQYLAVTTFSTGLTAFVISWLSSFWGSNPLHLPF